MAIATSLAVGVAAASGVLLGSSCKPRASAHDSDACEWISSSSIVANRRVPTPQDLPPQRLVVQEPRPVADEVPESVLRWEGFSMEESRAHADQAQLQAMSRSPHEVLAELQKGNTRFWTGRAREQAREERLRAQGFDLEAVPLGRRARLFGFAVPTEMIFDQGLGDIFVIRVAGNCLDTTASASLQYAVNHLEVKVLIVLGHELCGAVKAALLPKEQLEQEPAALQDLLRNIKDGLDENCLNLMHDSRAKDREAVISNVVRQVEGLTRDRSIMSKVEQGELIFRQSKVEQGELIISAAFYEISSGIVDFLSTLDKAAPSSKDASKATVPIEGKVDVSLGKQPAVFNNTTLLQARGLLRAPPEAAKTK
eukprot:CAMPEP_0177363796 /NCGR_PEP_ID=MMETSP0368-20130122/38445_1 /TAXON_ID=447022 ORGANISM="Scrippsiella hangoei-like, Strain SHHI-4" /NCGR_SAMPLE_ID=MMETSP0368 /ASSEMBLY_ACC=CAM_ASM_000363 /LENGTH=367 /DNA_ID=CAMNT_0018826609 /DNA_START=55 /DNA_END=1160 /DNA_ORIENTATION=+